MFSRVMSQWLTVLVVLTGTAMPAWAQHGGHGGGNHYGGFGGHSGFGGISIGGHGLGGFGIGGFGIGGHSFGGSGHHYSPSYHGYYGSGYGAYGHNSWPYSYTPRVYAYSVAPAVIVAPQSQPTHSHGPGSPATSGGTASEPGYKGAAEAAFRSHHYEEAIESAKRAAKETPRDGRVFLFLSQVHLAVGEYRDAAGAARLGMSLLPVEDWGYIVENFRDYYHDADYVAQVARLQRFIKENPDRADARLLLGYHWVFLGRSDAAQRDGYFAAARRELTQAASLDPRDEWATRLLEVVDGPRPQPPAVPAGSVRVAPERPTGVSESPPSVGTSVEYPPPQEFAKPGKSGGTDAHDHKH